MLSKYQDSSQVSTILDYLQAGWTGQSITCLTPSVLLTLSASDIALPIFMSLRIFQNACVHRRPLTTLELNMSKMLLYSTLRKGLMPGYIRK